MDEPDRDSDHSLLLALLRAPATPRALHRLVLRFGDCAGLFSADRADLAAAGAGAPLLQYLSAPDWRGVERDQHWLGKAGNALVVHGSPAYPELLREIADPPLALFVSGDPASLRELQLAIVGSRTPSADGRRLARAFAVEAVRNGLVVTSGMAIGIDGEAHAGALSAGGRTIAVLGNGLATIYPPRHAALAGQIVGSGALVSEFPVDYVPLPENFPRRNRIISGLSAGVLVVEAALPSGTLITANHALEQGREVFAVPGSIRNSRARGCHALIRQGAKLVEGIEDVLEEIRPMVPVVTHQPRAEQCDAFQGKALDANAKLLLDNMGSEPVNIDSLVETTALPVDMAASLLSNLEIAGLIESLPGGGYVRRRD
jgi:DNA processing protein